MIIGVTGSGGKLGRATVTRLREDGHESSGSTSPPPPVPVHARRPRRFRPDPRRLPLRHGEAYGARRARAPRSHPVNGLVPDATTFERNVVASFHALYGAYRAGIRRIVFASSITAAGFPFDEAPPSLPVDETFTRANNTYGLGKVAEEALAAQLSGWADDLSVTALRFTNVVDADEYATFARADDPDYRRDLLGSWIDARDGAAAVALALSAGPRLRGVLRRRPRVGFAPAVAGARGALVPRHPRRRRPGRVRVPLLHPQDPGPPRLPRRARLALILPPFPARLHPRAETAGYARCLGGQVQSRGKGGTMRLCESIQNGLR